MPDAGTRAHRRGLLAEIATGLVGAAILLHLLRHVLLTPVTRTFGHDLIFWYPVWQFYAEGLSLGELRFWNPLSYGGVALYPALLQLRAFDPITPLVVGIGHLVTDDLLARYNWEIFLRALVPAVTAHVFLRRFAVEPLARVALLAAVLGSSFLLVLLRVHGAGQGFLWAPIIGILLYRLLWLGDGRWCVFGGLAAFLGLNWQSYFIVPHGLFAAVFALGLLLSDPGRVRRVLAVERLVPKLAASALLLALMAVPLAVVVREGSEVVYLTRLFDTGRPVGKVGSIQYEPVPSSTVHEVGVLMPQEFFVRSGTPSTIWNFVQLVTPTGNWHREGGHGWGNPSEAFMYLGLPVYVTALLGIFMGRHPLRRAWLLVLALFGLLMLGPLGGAQSFLSFVIPPVRLARHAHTYTPYFQLALLFFFVLGADRLLARLRSRPAPDIDAPGPPTPCWLRRVSAGLTACFVVHLLVYETPTALRVFSIGKAVTPAALALGLLALWWLTRRLPRQRLFWTVLLAHLVAMPLLLGAAVLSGLHGPPAGGLAATLGRIGGYWALFLALPLALYRFGQRLEGQGRGLIVALLLSLLGADLFYYASYTSYLWDWPRPDRLLGVSSRVTSLAFHPTRGLYPVEAARTAVLGQVIRYPELLLRAPYLLAAPRQDVPTDGFAPTPDRMAESLDVLRNTQRWNSFYVPRRYLTLLHSEAPAPVLARIWGLGEPLLRFVPGHAVVGDDEFARVFHRLGPAAGRCALARVAVQPADPPVTADGAGAARESLGADARPCVEAAADAVLTVRFYAPGQLSLDATTARAGFVVVAETTHPRWAAWVDGRPTAIRRANYLAQAIAVPAGTHRVDLRFEPGILLPALAFFTMTGLVALLSVLVRGGLDLGRALAGTGEEKR